MSEDGHSWIVQMRRDIAAGRLTKETIEARLTEAIEAESEKGDNADIALMEACEDLLWELNAPGQQQPSVNKAELHQALDAAIAERAVKGKPCAWTYTRRIVAAAAAVLCLFCLTDGLLQRQWLTADSTQDQQQFVVEGHEISVSMIQSAIAEHDGMAKLTTQNFEELSSFLGFTPQIPSTFTKWSATSYRATIDSSRILVSTQYVGSDGSTDSFIYSTYYYTDISEAYVAFEQNKAGISVNIDATKAYVTQNENRTTICWNADAYVNIISGNITYDEGLKITETIIRGEYV